MAKMKLSESTFTLIPEGTYIFKVMSVDDEKYEDFGKLSVKLQTAKGETHYENFSLLSGKEVNEKALKAWSYFARTCLNNFNVDEIDTQDIVGCYIKATVTHEEFTYTKGDKKGKNGTNARLNDYVTATGFGGKSDNDTPENDEDDIDDIDDLDNFLDD